MLHDLGKLSQEFIIKQSNDSPNCNFEHEDILKSYTKNFDYTDFLPSRLKSIISKKEILSIFNKDLNNRDFKKGKYIFSQKLTDPSQLISKHHNKNSGIGLIKLLSNIDGLDSGVDKGLLQNKGKQPKDRVFKSASFGYEGEKNEIELLNLKIVRDELCNELANLLEQICENPDKIALIRRWILPLIKREFLKSLGDTRRSGNDVTLWDHSYSVASLYKAAIAKIIYENKWTEPSEIKWKIIGVQYDKLRLIEKAHKLTDIIGYRNLTEKIDENVKEIIEEELPIGNEIYRDETGIYFVGPSLREDDGTLEKCIRNKIIKKVDTISDGEVIPHVAISNPSRSLIILTELLKESTKNVSFFERTPLWKTKWQNVSTEVVHDIDSDRSFCKSKCKYFNKCISMDKKGKRFQIDICPVCKIHPKCEYQEVCKFCLNRREGRIKDWLPDLINKKYPTIWIDEIADSNGKVAIITGRFNLGNWLNGELLNTVFSQTLESYANEHKNWNSLFDSLKQELENNEKSEVLRKIAGESYHGQSPRQFYKDLVVERNPLWDTKLSNWDSSSCEKAAELLLLTVFRKHPSPSRLRRIWTSTEDFWIEMQNELKEDQGIYLELESKKNIENRFKRLEVILDEPFPKAKAVYHLKFGKVDLLSYYDGTKFVSIQNLQHFLLHKEDIAKYKQIDIRSEDEKNSEYKKYKVKEIKFSEKSYRPFLEILLSPVTFQFIVPANSVPAVLKKIKDKYDKEMGNITGRLPLNLGVVFFDYKTALYAAVNASRRMLNGFEDIELMNYSVSNFSKDSPTIDLEVYTKGTRKKKIQLRKSSDAQARYYFNFLINASEDEAQKRKSFFKTVIKHEQESLISGSDLGPDDCVKLYPNYFDFEFLDTTARRLEIRYKDHKRIRKSSLMGPRPYLLEEFTSVFEQIWKLFNKPTMTTSQLKNIQENLVKLHMDWKDCENQNEYEEVLKKQIENILVNVGSKNWWNSLAEGEKELLKEVCFDKTIFDILEFYNSILKLKPNGD